VQAARACVTIRYMQPRLASIRLLQSCLWLTLAACGAHQQSASDARFSKEADLQWRGLLGCADCDGIQTRLLLHHGATGREFQLTEIYLAHGQGARFDDHGHWQRQADLLQLQGDSGSLRVYALLKDGGLQPRDGHGAVLSPETDETLQLVKPSNDP
jgi:uncharacterized lipoprotein NlpE involved in copper resistance